MLAANYSLLYPLARTLEVAKVRLLVELSLVQSEGVDYIDHSLGRVVGILICLFCRCVCADV